jgi:exodeoxyribonuclease-3
MCLAMKLATFNANSVRARIDQIVDWLALEKPDILCLQETKVQDPDFPVEAFRNAGYHVVFRGQKAGAGVAVATREEARDVFYGFDEGRERDEARLIRLKAAGVSVINTYVPQGRDIESEHFAYKLKWFGRLRKLLEKHYAPTDLLVWCGDFNVAPEAIDVHDPKGLQNHVDFHPKARAALEKVRQWGFVDVFRQFHPGEAGRFSFWDYRVATNFEKNIGWRVDLIFATAPLAKKATKSWIDRDTRKKKNASDHTFVAAEFNL